MMKKLAIPLALVATATLAACASRPVTVSTATVVPANAAYVYPNGYVVAPERTAFLRPGFGRIESFVPVYYTTGAATGVHRIRLVMQDGSVQVIDTNGPTVAVGAWVEVTPQFSIMYPVAAR
jgi:hypothetical protein